MGKASVKKHSAGGGDVALLTHAANSAVAATDEGAQLLKEMQEHNSILQQELLGAGFAINRLVNTVRSLNLRGTRLAAVSAPLKLPNQTTLAPLLRQATLNIDAQR